MKFVRLFYISRERYGQRRASRNLIRERSIYEKQTRQIYARVESCDHSISLRYFIRNWRYPWEEAELGIREGDVIFPTCLPILLKTRVDRFKRASIACLQSVIT